MSVYIGGQGTLSLTNILPTPDNGWDVEGGTAIISATDITGVGVSGGTYAKIHSPRSLPFVTGHTYYVRAKITIETESQYTGEGRRLKVEFETRSFESNLAYIYGVETACSVMLNAPATSWVDWIFVTLAKLPDGTVVPGYRLRVSYPMAIDLTATFGAGKEPTKEWCDANIPDFFGTATIQSAEDVALSVGKIYIGDGGTAKRVHKAYIGDANGMARLTYTARSYTVTSTGNYGFSIAAQPPNPNPSDLDGVYRSDNYHVASSNAVSRIDFAGYDVFTIYIRSYAESNYDYIMTSTLDAASSPTQYTDGTVKAHTRGNQQSGTTIGAYTKVQYPTDGGMHHIYIAYRKDSSANQGDDRGYFLIER